MRDGSFHSIVVFRSAKERTFAEHWITFQPTSSQMGGLKYRQSRTKLALSATHSPAKHETTTMRIAVGLLAVFLLAFPFAGAAQDKVLTFEGKDGPGKGKHIVFLSGDEEYRSEESLPMLAKILSQRHGFKCSVVFPIDKNGHIDPNNQESISDSTVLDSADVIVMALRFRRWPDVDMQRFVEALKRGVPMIALRTSTHAFLSPYEEMNKFGERTLGEEWVSHWGNHKAEATKGIIEPAAKDHPLLRGVNNVFGDTDVYEAYPPSDAKILLRGQVLKGMTPDSPPASYKKKRASDKQEQDVNDPMMPVAWYRELKAPGGPTHKILCTTMGSATDFKNEGLRRLVVNGVYWGLGLDVPANGNVEFIDPYEPTMYGFGGFRKEIKIGDHALGKKLPEGKK